MSDRSEGPVRPIALVTGASRRAGISSAVCLDLAADGWDVAFTYWRRYDQRMAWGSNDDDVESTTDAIRAAGARTVSVEADLSQIDSVAGIFDAVNGALGPVTALVIGHCKSVNSDIRGTTVESFDRHMAVNARAPWLLLREFADLGVTANVVNPGPQTPAGSPLSRPR